MIAIKVIIDQDGALALTVRQTREVAHAAHKAIGETWRDEMLAEHFKSSAAKKYGYLERKPETRRRKRQDAAKGKARMGGWVALVWSGRLMDMMVGVPHRVQSFPSRAVVHMVGPHYLKINYKPGRPHLANEIMRVIPEEQQTLAVVAANAVSEKIKSLPERKRKVIQ